MMRRSDVENTSVTSKPGKGNGMERKEKLLKTEVLFLCLRTKVPLVEHVKCGRTMISGTGQRYLWICVSIPYLSERALQGFSKVGKVKNGVVPLL